MVKGFTPRISRIVSPIFGRWDNCGIVSQILFSVTLLLVAVQVDVTQGSRYTSRLAYENSCGDLAISCVANCPVFRNKCFASHVADSIREAIVTDPLIQSPTPATEVSIITGIPESPDYPESDCLKLKRKNYCIVPKDYDREEDCCPGARCVPFTHVNGRSAVIGYCRRYF